MECGGELQVAGCRLQVRDGWVGAFARKGSAGAVLIISVILIISIILIILTILIINMVLIILIILIMRPARTHQPHAPAQNCPQNPINHDTGTALYRDKGPPAAPLDTPASLT